MHVFGLIGYPLTHSFSKPYFTEKFARLGLTDHAYENFPLEQIENFPKLLATQSELTGLNVTIPYKETIVPYLDSLSSDADKIGAVNTICFESSRLVGYNTDWLGFRAAIMSLKEPPDDTWHALILGTGGGAKAVAYTLADLKIRYTFVSRRRLHFGKTYEELTPALIANARLIVNTTPLGMFPNVDAAPRIPYEALTADHLLFDLIYNPEETMFLRNGRENGARTENGKSMLVFQAEESWKLWQRYPSGFLF
jgi:shikimate dehydrogenase